MSEHADMTDDMKGLATLLEQAAAELRQRDRSPTWIKQFREGSILTSAEAATIASNDAQTIRRWCDETKNTARPLGHLIGKLWLVDAYELLYQVEKREDLHARRFAQTRLKEHQEKLARAPQSLKLPACATG